MRLSWSLVAAAIAVSSCRAPAARPPEPAPVAGEDREADDAGSDGATASIGRESPWCTLGAGPTQCASAGSGSPRLDCWSQLVAPRPLLLCSYQRGTGDPTELGLSGCMYATPTVLVVPGDAGATITTRAELARYLGVDSALAAMHYARIALGQSFYEELAGLHASAIPIAVGRYRVELLYRPTCGCFHDVSRVTLEVTAEGTLKELDRTLVAPSASHACVD